MLLSKGLPLELQLMGQPRPKLSTRLRSAICPQDRGLPKAKGVHLLRSTAAAPACFAQEGGRGGTALSTRMTVAPSFQEVPGDQARERAPWVRTRDRNQLECPPVT